MNVFYGILPTDVIEAIGWTIFHSLWQGILISVVFGFAVVFTDGRSSKFRYALGVTSLFLLLISSVLTFTKIYSGETITTSELRNFEIDNSSTINDSNSTVQLQKVDSISGILNESQKFFSAHLPVIVNIWLLGLLIFSLRYIGGLVYVHRLKTYGNLKLDKYWYNINLKFQNKLKLNKAVGIFESAFVKMPLTIGNLKPVILLPIGMLSGMPANQVEAIIAHELAHIKRYDFIINLFQSLIETIFFFHPAVWWISSRVRYERENCCDDIAVDLCGSKITYSKALVNIQQIASHKTSFALAVFNGENQLLKRIKRMNTQNKPRISYGIKFASFALLLFVIAAASLYSSKSFAHYPKQINTASIISPFAEAENEVLPQNNLNKSTPATPDTTNLLEGDHTFSFYEKENGERIHYKAKLKNGKLASLYRDGEKIPESDLKNYEDLVQDRVEDYNSLVNDLRSKRNEYKAMSKKYREKMREYRDKMRDYRDDNRYWNDNDFDGPDLSELREAMRELRHNLRHNLSQLTVNVPPIHIPEIDFDVPDIDVHIPPINVNVPRIHVPPIPPPAINHEEWDNWKDELKENMKELHEKMEDYDLNMDEFNDNMKSFGKKMRVFGIEMKKFGKFMHAAKDEMINDGLIESEDDIDSFELSEDRMKVNGNTVSSDLHKKYLDMYEEYTGKKLEGDRKIKIHD